MKTKDETAIIRFFAISGYVALAIGLLMIVVAGFIMSEWLVATQAGLWLILTGYIFLFISKEPGLK